MTKKCRLETASPQVYYRIPTPLTEYACSVSSTVRFLRKLAKVGGRARTTLGHICTRTYTQKHVQITLATHSRQESESTWERARVCEPVAARSGWKRITKSCWTIERLFRAESESGEEKPRAPTTNDRRLISGPVYTIDAPNLKWKTRSIY